MSPTSNEKGLAVPALIVGGFGLAIGVIGFILENGLPGAVAGILAGVAGLLGFRLQQRVLEQQKLHRLIGDELRSVRTKARVTEAELEAEISRLNAEVKNTTAPSKPNTGNPSSPKPGSPNPASTNQGSAKPGSPTSGGNQISVDRDGVIETRPSDTEIPGTDLTSAEFQQAVQKALDEEFESTVDARFDHDLESFGSDDLDPSLGDSLDDVGPFEGAEPFEGVSLDPLSDPVSGLFNELFFSEMLSARVAAARRHLRPVATVVLEVVQGLPSDDVHSASPDIVTEGIVATLRESDTAARLDNGTYAFLLEDTPENGAIWTVERVRRQLVADHPDLSLRAGVACYPAHAFTSADVLAAASTALKTARDWRQDRIEVAAEIAD